MEIKWLSYGLSLVTGMGLGVLFFAGLLFTVYFAKNSRLIGLWFIASFLLRTVLLMAGLYACSGHQAGNIFVCFVGVLLGRHLVIRLTSANHTKSNTAAKHNSL